MTADRRRVLVARLDSGGDVLLTGPAVRAVAAQQDRPVVFLCGPRGQAAAALLPDVESIVTFRAPWIEPDPMPVRGVDSDRFVEIVQQLGVDEAIILGSSHQSPLPLALLLRWAGVGRIGAVSQQHAGSLLDVRVPGDPDLHEVERNLAVLTALGYDRPSDDRLRVDLQPRQLTSEADGANDDLRRSPLLGGSAPGEYVVVHPGASAPARTLAPAVWSRVVQRLREDGRPVLVTGSPQERHLTHTVTGTHRGVIDLGGRTTFRALGRVLAGAAAFVSGNTGPLHLAAAVGTPTVAVFPPTVPPERWRPWRVPQVVLGDQGVECAGCRSRECPLPEQLCLHDVEADVVAAAVDQLVDAPETVEIDLRTPPDAVTRDARGRRRRRGARRAAEDRPGVRS